MPLKKGPNGQGSNPAVAQKKPLPLENDGLAIAVCVWPLMSRMAGLVAVVHRARAGRVDTKKHPEFVLPSFEIS